MVICVSQTLSALEGLIFMLATMAAIITAITATRPIILDVFFTLLLYAFLGEVFFIYYCNISFLSEAFERKYSNNDGKPGNNGRDGTGYS